MNEASQEQERVKCPFCAELILPDAIKCRFCQSDLINDAKNKSIEKAPIGLWRAFVLNIVCPGLAAWKLGHKLRGAAVLVAVLGCMAIYSHQVIPVINKKIKVAMTTGNTTKLNSLTTDLADNPWLDWSFYIYAYSFVDLIFLIKTDKTKIPTEEGDEKTNVT